MMTKDKKPFTYTPGGIDLSEIKSPRMARRIERNANAPGVGEIPQTPPTPQQSRPLPPSALAAMQPALPIQVFPTGAPPPPPPPPVNAPPPPPMQPLPTKPVATNDGVYERPDMTRIIPENPMALLRKTPKVERRTFLDELNDMERKNMQQAPMQQAPMSPQAQPQYSPPARSQPPTPQFTPAQYTRQPSYTTPAQPYSPQSQAYAPQNAHPVPQMVSPQVVENNGPPSPPTKTSKVNIGSLYIPPINQQQQQPVQSQPSPKSQQSSAPPTPPQRQVQTPPTPQSPIPKLNAAPKPWQNQQRKEPELPEWAQRHQQSPPKEEQVQPVRMTGPPRVTPVQMQPPPARPGVEVVWVTQPEVYQHPGPTPPPGQRRVPPHITQQQQQQQQMQQQQMQQMQQQQMQRQQQSQQQYVQQEMKGTRIIPIQIEGQNSGPNTPATPERNFNRQQSWTPTQSNAFKVIQKMTNTDGMEDEADQQQVEYGPRTAQQFPNEQMRKMNLNDSDRDFMNRVKQDTRTNNRDDPNLRYLGGHIPSRVFRYLDESGVDREIYLHNEPDPRYRGSEIPSKAFRMLQQITDTPPDDPDTPRTTPTVPQNQPQGPYVRKIPIQVEGDMNNTNQPYVHPSQQTVEEPKKYMGSAIPSRAFRMVQAMTSNSPAAGNNDKQSSEITDKKDVCEISEPHPPPNTLPPSNAPYPYNPNWNYDPYWYDYYAYYYPNYVPPPNNAQTKPLSNEATPPWGYPPYPSVTPTQEVESLCSSCRNTPVPFWGYYPGGYNQQGYESDTNTNTSEANTSYRNTPASCDYRYYWDPYYYPYYPPPPHLAYGLYPYYPGHPADYDGYCSTEEMNNINLNDSASVNGTQHVLDDTTETTHKIPSESTISPIDDFSDNQSEATIVDDRGDMDADDADSESSSEDEEVEEIYRRSTSNVPLIEQDQQPEPVLSSKTPVHMFVTNPSDEDLSDDEQDQEVIHHEEDPNEPNGDEQDDDVASVYIDDDQMPHVLSVIYEESERSFSSRMDRESSIASTISQSTLVEEADEGSEGEDYEAEVLCAKLPLTLRQTEGKVELTVGDAKSEDVSSNPHSIDSKFSERCLSEIQNALAAPPTVQLGEEAGSDVSNIAESNIKEPSPDRCHLILSQDESNVDDSNNSLIVEAVSETSPVEVTQDEPEDQNDEGEEVDFWSQIKKDDDDELPRRQVFYNKYRDSVYSKEETDSGEETKASEEVVQTQTTIEEDDTSSKMEVETVKTTESFSAIKDADDNVRNEVLSKEEREVLTLQEAETDNGVTATVGKSLNVSEHKILAQKVDNVEITLDVLSNRNEEQTSSIGLVVSDGQMEKIAIDECNVSNTVVTKAEVRETLFAPKFDLGLADCFMNIQNHLKLTLEGLKTKEPPVEPEPESEIPVEANEIQRNDSELIETEMVPQEISSEIEDKEVSVENTNNIEKECSVEETSLPSNNLPSSSVPDDIDKEVNDLNNNAQEFYVPTIKERIRALQNASRNSTPIRKPSLDLSVTQEPVVTTDGKDFLTPELVMPKSSKTSTKSSIKSIEDNSEDEIDSGVTSDMSRHISDTESESVHEIRKTIKYQRAATHSRLYKLLQDECDEDDEEDQLATPADCAMRKEKLSLPLKSSSQFSHDESGFNSPASPITDELVNNLVTNLLKNKTVELKNVPMEVLQAAALKILQEDRDCKDLSSSDELNSFLSPLLLDGSATTAQTPQEFYTSNEYNQYYETWGNAQQVDIPSKSFKLLQEIASEASKDTEKQFTAKCPRTTTSAEVRRKYNATPTNTASHSCTPVPAPSFATQEASSAS